MRETLQKNLPCLLTICSLLFAGCFPLKTTFKISPHTTVTVPPYHHAKIWGVGDSRTSATFTTSKGKVRIAGEILYVQRNDNTLWERYDSLPTYSMVSVQPDLTVVCDGVKISYSRQVKEEELEN